MCFSFFQIAHNGSVPAEVGNDTIEEGIIPSQNLQNGQSSIMHKPGWQEQNKLPTLPTGNINLYSLALNISNSFVSEARIWYCHSIPHYSISVNCFSQIWRAVTDKVVFSNNIDQRDFPGIKEVSSSAFKVEENIKQFLTTYILLIKMPV